MTTPEGKFCFEVHWVTQWSRQMLVTNLKSITSTVLNIHQQIVWLTTSKSFLYYEALDSLLDKRRHLKDVILYSRAVNLWVLINWLKRWWAQPLWDLCTILTTLHLLAELRHVVWPYGSKELDVVITVIFCHLLCCGFVWSLKHRTKELGEN